MHGEWLRYAKSTSQYSLAFSLKVRDDWGFQVNPLCCHDITRGDRQIGNNSFINLVDMGSNKHVGLNAVISLFNSSRPLAVKHCSCSWMTIIEAKS